MDSQPLTLDRRSMMSEQIANENAADLLHAIKQTMLQNLLVTFVDADHAPD
jgi:hypothetical protein